MAEYLTDAEYWKSVALDQALRAIKAELENASQALNKHATELHEKYNLVPGEDRLEERQGKIEIIRVMRADGQVPAQVLEAVK